jgi:hypothetical protein
VTRPPHSAADPDDCRMRAAFQGNLSHP